MKREDIEFRIWAPYQGGFFFEWSAKKYWELHGVSQEGLTFQQYTGVKDVKGKKIFEGDYVVLDYANIPEKYQMENVFEIVFGRGTFSLQARKLHKYDGCFCVSWIKYIMGERKDGTTIYKYKLPGPVPLTNFNICRVIGNVFENP